ncbi:hypothetical protein HPB48_021381 [Haemaphysalis longicornis]|uniref:BACK domain-containing protein n=1 Tax=Haemaphysalis longicornis TaxID=44386 RepID=A0A9J6FLC7_HAELO|nr:hypothetical protein HPB48_021381 [Haemaphysalis longicornis]
MSLKKLHQHPRSRQPLQLLRSRKQDVQVPDAALRGDLEECEELFKLEIDKVESLLSDQNVNVAEEGSVWRAALLWVEFKPANREQYIARLQLRPGLVGTDFFIEKIKTHRYVVGSEAFKPIVTDSLRFLYGLSFVARNDEVRTPALPRPRIPHEAMFVIGGWMNGGPTACIDSYDSKADRARCFTAHTKTWRSTTPMHVKRGYVSVAMLSDVHSCHSFMPVIIHAMGGYDEREGQSSAEKFDYRNNQWAVIASMNQQHSDAYATAHSGYVYMTGGFGGSECLISSERYTTVRRVEGHREHAPHAERSWLHRVSGEHPRNKRLQRSLETLFCREVQPRDKHVDPATKHGQCKEQLCCRPHRQPGVCLWRVLGRERD